MNQAKLISSLGIVLATTFCLTGCTGNSADVDRLTTENRQLRAQVQQLQTQVTEAQSKAAGEAATTVVASAIVPAAAAITPDVRAAAVAGGQFTDIAGVFGEKQIKDLLCIGVLDASGGNFDPSRPITRSEFVAWLVKTNNQICPEERQIRLAEASTPSSFTDMNPTTANYNYIQGMADAGWSVGYPDKTFKPDKVLTREEMIAIKTPLDHGGKGYDGYETRWNDGDKIQETFRAAMSDENFGKHNWIRIFGDTKSCNPQKPVSRAEAAVCVWKIGWHDSQSYTAEKPGKTAPQ